MYGGSVAWWWTGDKSERCGCIEVDELACGWVGELDVFGVQHQTFVGSSVEVIAYDRSIVFIPLISVSISGSINV